MQKILIIDDEAYIRTLLEQTLEDLQEEHHVTLLTAHHGLDGWEKALSEKPDLVFLDIMMPEMDGFEVCRRIAAETTLQNTKVVLLTARGQEVDKQAGLQAGAKEYITKPFDPDDVLAIARRELQLD